MHRERIVAQTVLKYLILLMSIAIFITSPEDLTLLFGAIIFALIIMDFNEFSRNVKCNDCGKLSFKNPYTNGQRWWPHKHSE
jgi:hypothetical protein